MGGSCSGKEAEAGTQAGGQAGRLEQRWPYMEIPTSQLPAFESALAWEEGGAAVPRNLTAFLPKGLPGRSRENRLLFAWATLKATRPSGARNRGIPQSPSAAASHSPSVPQSGAGRRGSTGPEPHKKG